MAFTAVLSWVCQWLEPGCRALSPASGATLGAASGPRCLRLPEGAVWSATLRRGDAVSCPGGTVWLTQAGEARDYVLSAGRAFDCKRRGKIVVTALEDARVTVTAARRRRWRT